MKKIGLLITLLIGGLLLTGCNKGEYSEYGLLQRPNGTITLKNFEREGKIYLDSFEEGILGDTSENAAVMLAFRTDYNLLYTPNEYNFSPNEAHETDKIYWTDLKTFRKVTGLKEASPEYVENLDGVYLFDPYTKFYKTREERENIMKEKSIEEYEIIGESYNDEFIDGFTGTILNGNQKQSFIIIGDNTLYYNDEFGFAMKLGKEWNGAKIEIGKWCEDEDCTEVEYPNYAMINILKPKAKEEWPMDWYNVISFSILSKDEYEKRTELLIGDEICDDKCFQKNTIGHNNKYYFQLVYTNQSDDEIYDLFQGQLDCKLNYPEREEWNYPWLPWDCSEALPKIVPEYYFYSIMSDLPNILDE